MDRRQLERGKHGVLPHLARPRGRVHSTVSNLTPAGTVLLRSIKAVCRELQAARRGSQIR